MTTDQSPGNAMTGVPATARAYVCASHSPIMTLPGKDAFGLSYQQSMRDAKQFVAEFDPDLVVMFAPDHMNLHHHVRPQFTVVLSGGLLEEFGLLPIDLAIDAEAAAHVSTELAAVDIDIAVAEDVRVDHGLGLSLGQLFDRPSEVNLVPVIVNAIGFPLAPLQRAATVGAAVGAALRTWPGRVLFIGSGGLSHHPPFPDPAPGARRLSPEERNAAMADAARYIDPEWDRQALAAYTRGDRTWLDRQSQVDLDRCGGGANELRVWAAAWAACGYAAATHTSYEPVPEWITGMGVAFGRGAAA